MRSRLALLALCLSTAPAMAQLGPSPAPPENPTTPAKAVLGKILFWEEQLSSDDSMACGTCHRPEAGGADPREVGWHPGLDGAISTGDDVRGSIGMVLQAANGDFVPSPTFGFEPQTTRRATPTVLGAGHHRTLNWDGSASDRFVDPVSGEERIRTGGALETQALLPILNPEEMGRLGRTWSDVTQKLAAVVPLQLAHNPTPDIVAALQTSPSYPDLFAAAFGDPRITPVRIAFALASYQRTLNPDDTPWDRYIAGDPTAMTGLEVIGWDLFRTTGQCLQCHQTPLFADSGFHNLGLRPAAEDRGHGAVVPGPEAIGAFRTPTLRNAGLRPRLFHNGRGEYLGHPINFYVPDSPLNAHWRGGGGFDEDFERKLPNLQALGVSQNEAALMFEFVRTALVDPRARDGLPPFDHPDLRSMVEPPPRLFGASLAGASEPFLVDWVPSYAGNAEFKLGLVGGQPGRLAILAIGLQSIEPTVWLNGLPGNLVPSSLMFFTMQGHPAEPGYATWHVSLAGLPNLSNVPLYYQLFVGDQGAPGGLAASVGTEFYIR